MSAFTLTRLAKADLKSIARFTENHRGREQLYIYIKQFGDIFHMFADTPEIGRNCSYITPSYQKLITENIVTENIITKNFLKEAI